MARRTLSPALHYWNTFQQLYVDVFSSALRELAGKSPIPGDEDDISEILYLILREVCFNIERSHPGKEIRYPIREAPIPPAAWHELKGGKKGKRPDFTCYYFNSHALSPAEKEIPLHVECKLLGKPTSPSWNLNKNYVCDGIKRFDCNTHEYGKHTPAGMLVGYIIDMTPREIEKEVNGYKNKYLPDFPDLRFKFEAAPPFQTYQKITRRHVEPVQFELVHMWADLRDSKNASGSQGAL